MSITPLSLVEVLRPFSSVRCASFEINVATRFQVWVKAEGFNIKFECIKPHTAQRQSWKPSGHQTRWQGSLLCLTNAIVSSSFRCNVTSVTHQDFMGSYVWILTPKQYLTPNKFNQVSTLCSSSKLSFQHHLVCYWCSKVSILAEWVKHTHPCVRNPSGMFRDSAFPPLPVSSKAN